MHSSQSAYGFIKAMSGIQEGSWDYSNYSIDMARSMSSNLAEDFDELCDLSGGDGIDGLEVVSSCLPAGFGRGEWPIGFSMSDHAPLTSTLRFKSVTSPVLQEETRAAA